MSKSICNGTLTSHEEPKSHKCRDERVHVHQHIDMRSFLFCGYAAANTREKRVAISNISVNAETTLLDASEEQLAGCHGGSETGRDSVVQIEWLTSHSLKPLCGYLRREVDVSTKSIKRHVLLVAPGKPNDSRPGTEPRLFLHNARMNYDCGSIKSCP